MRLKRNLASSPPGGWHYPEEETILRGKTPEEVITRIRTYRLQNAKSVGDPNHDFIQFVAMHWPQFISYAHEDLSSEELEAEILSDLRGWLIEMARKPQSVNLAEVWDHNFKTCLRCPHNQPVPTSPQDVAQDVERRAFMLARGIEMEGVGCCTLQHWDNRVACVLDRKALNPESHVPAFCWLSQAVPHTVLAGVPRPSA